MNWKILLKAMKFSLLPTLLTFTLLFLGFMSFTDAFNFLTSNNGWSIFVRISLFIAEILLIAVMYDIYHKEHILKEAITLSFGDKKVIAKNINPYTDTKDLFENNNNNNNTYYKYKTENSDIIIIEKKS